MRSAAIFLVLVLIALVCAKTPFFRNSRKFITSAPVATESERVTVKQDLSRFKANPFENSGYINVNATFGANLYYLFFEAQNGRQDAPVILWLQGGPGCASMFGAFIENGPYHVTPQLTLTPNPYSWNKEYHVLYIDNPVGSGFSYLQNKEGYVHTESQVAEELYTFLIHFFTKYSQYSKNAFYVFGESYAGKYVPAISYKIMAEGFKVNLKGLGIGDGLTHPIEQFTKYDEYAFSTGLINQAQRSQLVKLQNNCTQLIVEQKWSAAMDVADDILGTVVQWGGNVNVYDIRTYQDIDDTTMIKYFALPEVKQLMHTVGHEYHDCDPTVYKYLRDDMPQSVRNLVTALLNKGVPVILYNGQYDLIINNVGAETWINNMPWTGQTQYLNAKRVPWMVSGNVAGYYQGYGALHQVIVVGAGHMSPYDQPANLQAMVKKFIEGGFKEMQK